MRNGFLLDRASPPPYQAVIAFVGGNDKRHIIVLSAYRFRAEALPVKMALQDEERAFRTEEERL